MNAIATKQDEFYQTTIKMVIDSVRSIHSKRAYQRALTGFVDWHKSNGQPTLNKATVQAYIADLAQQGKTPSVINQALSSIRKMAREAADNGLLEETLAAGIGRIENVENETLPAGRSIDQGEITAMLNSCAQDASPLGIRDAAIISLAYACGLRRGSIVNLDFADYEPDTGKLIVRQAKRNKTYTAYARNGAKAALDDWLKVRGSDPGAMFFQVRKGGHIKPKRLTTQAVYHVIKARAEQANIDKSTMPHDFRHTFIGDLLDAGVDIAIVSKMAGHSDVSTTARYDRRPEKAKRKAAGMLHVPYIKSSYWGLAR